MMNISINDQMMFAAFGVGFSRWMAVLFQIPLFDNLAVPNLVKILTSFVISFAFFPSLQSQLYKEVISLGTENLWILVTFHTSVGLIIGFLVKILMSLFVATGSMLTQQIGFSSVSYFDPTQAQQVGPFERMLEWSILITVLSSGALLPIFKGIYLSFFSINFFDSVRLTQSPEYFIHFFKSAFSSSILLAGPLIFASLLMNLIFGIVARTVPQMNVLMVSFVVSIGLGLLLFLAIIDEFFKVSFELYVSNLGNWFQFISNK